MKNSETIKTGKIHIVLSLLSDRFIFRSPNSKALFDLVMLNSHSSLIRVNTVYQSQNLFQTYHNQKPMDRSKY